MRVQPLEVRAGDLGRRGDDLARIVHEARGV
jgi:hypothetical protein